jgi:hypothetical protein
MRFLAFDPRQMDCRPARPLITLRISGRPFFRRADDVAPSLQRLMHQLAQKTENNLLEAIFSIRDFSNQCLENSRCVHRPAVAAAELQALAPALLPSNYKCVAEQRYAHRTGIKERLA